MGTNEYQLLVSTAVQLPIVVVFAVFVRYMLQYNSDQMKTIVNAFSKSQEAIADQINNQNQQWREFVDQRDGRYREVLKELEFTIRSGNGWNRNGDNGDRGKDSGD